MQRNKKKQRWFGCLAAAFFVVFGAVFGMLLPDRAAQAVDFDKACSLTIIPGGGEFAEDLAAADLVIDLYQVAKAAPVSGYDTYTYEFTGDFSKLSISEHPSDGEWKELSGKAAEIALKGGVPTVVAAPAFEPVENLGSGLYLAIARGKGIEDYIVTTENEDGKQMLATVAYSDEHIYTMLPALVSLPGKEAGEDGSQETSGSGEWLYHMETALKLEQSPRYGSLEIVKRLASYETKDPATFVFEVEAVLKDKVVYSDVVSLSFTEPGEKKVLLEKLPVGAQVTVTEVYSGAVYKPTSSAEQTVVIEAEKAVWTVFDNDYNETNKGGGSVTNRFDYSPDSGWGWTKITDEE